MAKTFAALVAAAILATAVLTTAEARCIGCERPPEAPPGYVYYPYGEPLPGPNCYGYRVPVYDPLTWSAGAGVQWRSAPG